MVVLNINIYLHIKSNPAEQLGTIYPDDPHLKMRNGTDIHILLLLTNYAMNFHCERMRLDILCIMLKEMLLNRDMIEMFILQWCLVKIDY